MAVINIDGLQYESESLSEECKAQLQMVQLVDQEIERLNALMAIAQTARITYGKALRDALPPPNDTIKVS